MSRLLLKGSFVQNFAFVFGGKTVIFIIGFIAVPIIARVYSPSAYGTYALYNSIVMNLAILVSLKIPASFVVIQDEARFHSVIRGLIAFIICSFIFISIIFFFADNCFFSSIENKSLVGFWYLIAVGVLLNVLTDVMGSWNVREKAFKKSTSVAISETLGTKIGSLVIGFVFGGINIGLILGEFIGKILHLGIQLPLFVKKRLHYLIPNFSIDNFKWLLKEYREYPLYLLPSTWLGQVSTSMIIIYFSAIFDADLVGSYSMATGLISIPIMLVAYASQPVLTQKIVQLSMDKKSIKEPVQKFTSGVLMLSFPVLIVGSLFGEWSIQLFLGENWMLSAKIVSWMIPLVGIQLLVMPMKGVLIGLKKNKEILYCDIMRIIFLIFILATAFMINADYTTIVKLFIVGLFLSEVLPLFSMYRVSKISLSRWNVFWFICYILTTVVCYKLIDFI